VNVLRHAPPLVFLLEAFEFSNIIGA